MAYVNTSGVITAMYACIVTLVKSFPGAPYFVQSSSATASAGSFTRRQSGNNVRR